MKAIEVTAPKNFGPAGSPAGRRNDTFHSIFPRASGDVACGPLAGSDHFAFLLGKPVGAVCCDGSLIAEGLLRFAELYQPDFLVIFSDVYVEAEALGVTLEFPDDACPRPVGYPDLNVLREAEPSTGGRMPSLLEAARAARMRLGGDFPIFYSLKDPFSLAALLTGADRFLEMPAADPQKADAILQFCAAQQSRYISVICREGYIPLIGAPFASGSLLGPRWFSRYAAPGISELFSQCDLAGRSRSLHICGAIEPIAEALTGLDTDLFSFEQWCPTVFDDASPVVPMGFVPTELFQAGSAKMITDATAECLARMSRPCILSTACDLPARADPDFVLQMLRAARSPMVSMPEA